MSQPLTPSPLSPSLVLDVAQCVNRFESDWEAGGEPRLEDLVAEAPEEIRPELFRQLLRWRWTCAASGPAADRPRGASSFGGLGEWAVPVLASLGLDAASAPLVLDVVAGPLAGPLLQLPGHGNFIIGRGTDRDGVHLSFRDDKGMSRLHFLLESNPPLARVVDLRSTQQDLPQRQRGQGSPPARRRRDPRRPDPFQGPPAARRPDGSRRERFRPPDRAGPVRIP